MFPTGRRNLLLQLRWHVAQSVAVGTAIADRVLRQKCIRLYSSGGNPFITVVKPAELRDSNDPSVVHHESGNRALLAQR